MSGGKSKQPLTQKQQILQHLTPSRRRRFPTLTQEEANKEYGIKSLSARVAELRWKDGYPIKSDHFIRKEDGRILVRYSLAT